MGSPPLIKRRLPQINLACTKPRMLCSRVARTRPFLVRRLCTKPSSSSVPRASSSSSASPPPAQSKLREYFSKYGKPGIALYIGVYLTTLGSLWGAVDSGLLPAGDAISLIRRVGADRLLPEGTLDKINPKAGSFAVAWVLAKFTEPFRFAFVVAVTPRLVRAFARR